MLEDQAASFGLQAIPVGTTGENVYFGLAASNAVGDTEVLPFFQPQREQFLNALKEAFAQLFLFVQPAPFCVCDFLHCQILNLVQRYP